MIGRSSAAPTRIPVEQIVRAFERRDAEELRRMVHPDAVSRP
jgi:predicted lipid-binding transport protein (Tim44 family)